MYLVCIIFSMDMLHGNEDMFYYIRVTRAILEYLTAYSFSLCNH